MKRLFILAFLLSTPAFAGDPNDPAREKIDSLSSDFYKETYITNLRKLNCNVDFDERVQVLDFFERFLEDVYEEAGIPEESRKNNWVEGDALAKKDDAHFSLEAEGVVKFDEETHVLSCG